MDTLDAVRKGHIWVLLQQPHEIEAAYGDLLRDIYAELEERVPGFKSYKHKMSILISSPKVQVYYHADVPGQTLWQVRGTKRVYVYPNTAPFLPQPGIEKIVLGEAHEISLAYEPWFDDYAEVIDLKPGRMLHWPLNCPHRIVNADCLNVSFTTEHMTDDLRNVYAVNYANGILRRTLGPAEPGPADLGLGPLRPARRWRRPTSSPVCRRAASRASRSTSRSIRRHPSACATCRPSTCANSFRWGKKRGEASAFGPGPFSLTSGPASHTFRPNPTARGDEPPPCP